MKTRPEISKNFAEIVVNELKDHKGYQNAPACIRAQKCRLSRWFLACVMVIVPIIAFTWSGQRANAQTLSCSLSQLTSGQASTASINAAISDDESRIALAVARNPTGGNADINQEIFLYKR